VPTRLVALVAPPERFAAALRTVWQAGDAALPLPLAAPRAAVQELLATLRPHEVRAVDPAGGVSVEPCGDPLPCADDLALVVATSGSTAAPKGVELTHAALRASTAASVARLGCRPGERWVLALPAHHVAGVQVVLRAWALGSEPVVFDRRDVATLAALAAAPAAGADRPDAAAVTPAAGADRPDAAAVTPAAGADPPHISLVPTQLARLVAAGVALDGFRTILLGGAPAEPELLTAARALGGRVVRSYGMSETSGGCVYDGVPLDGVEVAVTPAGRIRLRGPMLLRAYRGEAPGTGKAPDAADWERDALDADGWFTTSDIGRWDGRRLEVLGRADDVVLSGGENVPVDAVAATLRTHPAVRDALVVGKPDPEWGEVAVAVVVLEDPAARPTLEALRAHVRASHPAAHAPRALVLVPALPRDAMGKVAAASLRHLAADAPDDG
jgi:o-succinylbenzoate---CoA ligase